jgi:hypothetical protein
MDHHTSLFILNTTLHIKITSKDVDYFKTVLAPNNVIYEADPENQNMLSYNTDWFNLYRGSSS